MNITKLVKAASVVVTMMAAPALLADSTVTLTQDAYSYAVGGEFNAVTTGPQSFLNNYASSTVINGGFQTFCIETTVDFYPNTTYYYTLSQTDSMVPGRALTEGAAFLYYEFAKGTLAGYDYTHTAARLADAGLLQAAIWWFQYHQTYSGYTIPTLSNNIYYALAMSTLGLTTATEETANNGTYGVEVLQMWANADDTGAAQNQLVLVADGGTTALMLGMSLGVLLIIGVSGRKV